MSQVTGGGHKGLTAVDSLSRVGFDTASPQAGISATDNHPYPSIVLVVDYHPLSPDGEVLFVEPCPRTIT